MESENIESKSFSELEEFEAYSSGNWIIIKIDPTQAYAINSKNLNMASITLKKLQDIDSTQINSLIDSQESQTTKDWNIKRELNQQKNIQSMKLIGLNEKSKSFFLINILFFSEEFDDERLLDLFCK
ncbi:MAG: hypothetical protein ACTSO9_06420 [Candidatus Helarchaeota archaeon]